jgi:hypothetical protein
MSNVSIEAPCTLSGSSLGELHKLRVEIESLAIEIPLEVFEVLARSARDIEKAFGLRNSNVDGATDPRRFTGRVLEGISQVVEVGRLVEHVQKCGSEVRARRPCPVRRTWDAAETCHNGETAQSWQTKWW